MWIHNLSKNKLYSFQNNNNMQVYVLHSYFYDYMHLCRNKLAAVYMYIQCMTANLLITWYCDTLQRLLSKFHGPVANHCQYISSPVSLRESGRYIYMQTPACDDTHGQSFKTTMHSLTKKLTIFFFWNLRISLTRTV